VSKNLNSQQLNCKLQIKFLSSFYRPDRFPPSTIAHSGKNPLGSFAQFMSHDPITNVDVHRDNRHTGKKVNIEKEFPFMKNKVPYGTTTH